MFLPSSQVSWSGDNPPPFVGKENCLQSAKSSANAKVATMEVEIIDKTSKIQKYEEIFPVMLDDLKNLHEENGGGTNRELAKKTKKAADDLKSKSKALEEASKWEEMLTLKMAQEISARAKAKADAVMYSKCVEQSGPERYEIGWF